MIPFLAFDLTRLFLAPTQRTPRGIDRVDTGLAKHFLKEWRGDCAATLPAPWGVRCVARQDALRLVERVETEWGENADPGREMLLDKVKQRLAGRVARADAPTHSARPYGVNIAVAVAKMAGDLRYSFGPLAAAAIPQGALYVNVGQVGIAIPRFLSWLDRRPDIKPVFMLHDTIPIDFAEFVPPASRRFHQSMIASAARHAAGLIVTTEAARTSIQRELRRCGRDEIPCLAEHLPVPSAFAGGREADAELSGVPYFVMVGAIEPRKNHLLLLNLWRDLVRQHGKVAPKLVIVGNRWVKYDAVANVLDRSTALQDHVIEVSGLSSPALRRLLSNARGLLMPSLAEGFGLPIIEALALGTPVIASDIPAHREAGGDYATYLSPIDGLGWLTEICSHAEDPAAFHKRLAGYRARSWSEYVQRLEPFLLAVAAQAERVPVAPALPAPAEAFAGTEEPRRRIR